MFGFRVNKVYFILSFFLMVPRLMQGQGYTKEEVDSVVAYAKEVYYSSPRQSMSLAHKIIKWSDSLNYEYGRLEGLRLIGNSFYLIGRMDSASLYMLRSLDQAYSAGQLGMQADVMIDIGQLYDKIGLHSLAYDYLRHAHDIRLQIGDPERLSVTFINLAYHYYLRDELDSALYYYKETEIILDTIPLTYTKPFLYNELGGVYLKQGRFDLARKNISKAMDLNLQMDNNWDLSYNYVLMADLELQLGNVDAAEENALKALKVSEESDISLEFDQIYEILSKVKVQQGRHSEAFDYLMRSYTYSDSLDLALTGQKILALDHYKRQKENEIATLKLVNENLEQDVHIANQRYLLVIILLVLVFVLGAVGLLYFQNKRLKHAQKRISIQNEDLKNLNTTKNKLFSIITHDIRNPLSNINGMLKLAQEGHITIDEFNKYAGTLADQTDRLSSLTETLINWSRSQQKGLAASLEEVDLEGLIAQSIQFVSLMADNKGISVNQVHSDPIGSVKTDPNMLMLILNNLLTNAIKFTPKQGTIDVIVSNSEDTFEIQISDSGIGISPQLMDQLLNGRIQTQVGTQNEKGSGMGLVLTLDLVTYMGGKLWAQNNEKGGSSFFVSFPIKD